MALAWPLPKSVKAGSEYNFCVSRGPLALGSHSWKCSPYSHRWTMGRRAAIGEVEEWGRFRGSCCLAKSPKFPFITAVWSLCSPHPLDLPLFLSFLCPVASRPLCTPIHSLIAFSSQLLSTGCVVPVTQQLILLFHFFSQGNVSVVAWPLCWSPAADKLLITMRMQTGKDPPPPPPCPRTAVR